MKKTHDGCVIWTVCTHSEFSSSSLTNKIYLLQDICCTGWDRMLIWCKFIHSLKFSGVTSSSLGRLPFHFLVTTALLRWLCALLCARSSCKPPPRQWCFHSSGSAPAAPAAVWKAARRTKRPSVSACSMAHWHQVCFLAWFSCCMWEADFYLPDMQSIPSEKRVAWFLRVQQLCTVTLSADVSKKVYETVVEELR